MLSKKGQKRRIPLKVYICDDNPVFLKNFSQQIQDLAVHYDWDCQVTLFESVNALLASDLTDADAIFLDIDMPTYNGIDAARMLRETYPEVIIVFVTGYIQYARDGYHVDAFRYLMKDSLRDELPSCLRDIWNRLFQEQKSILVQSEGTPLHVQLNKILFFEGTNQRKVIMHTATESIRCTGQLLDYEKNLSELGFLRIQRSFLVNMQHILWINNYKVCLSNGVVLKASERSYAMLSQQYLLWKGKHK